MDLKNLTDKIDMDQVGNVVNEVQKAVDVDKVKDAAIKDGKLDVKGAATAISQEISQDEAANIADAAKKLIK